MAVSDVSKQLLGKMKKLGVLHRRDLPMYLPFRYDDYRTPCTSIEIAMISDEKQYLKFTLTKEPKIEHPNSGPSRVRLEFTDGRYTITSMVFGNTRSWEVYHTGNSVHITAKTSSFNSQPQLKGVEIVPNNEQGKIVPRYRGRPKVITTTSISQQVKKALVLYMYESIEYIEKVMDMSEDEICKRAFLPFDNLSDLINTLHYPASMKDLNIAIDSVRLIHALQALTLIEQSQPVRDSKNSKISYRINFLRELVNGLPFKLTHDQKKAIWDIVRDIDKSEPMDRLLSGDVGCGKTLSYGIPAVSSHLEGKKTVIMMPNSLLATQVAQELSEFFPKANVSLLIGNNKKDHKDVSESDLIVGTTAIIWWVKSKPGYKIDFLIIDEQQKIGVEQKNILISENTNLLEATATAIPQTMASVMYGTKPISRIEQLPVVKNIKTEIVDKTKHSKVYHEMLRLIDNGSQIAILYPKRTHTPVENYMFMIPETLETKQLKSELRELGAKNIKKFLEIEPLEGYVYWQLQYPVTESVNFLEIVNPIKQLYGLKGIDYFVPENEKDPALKAVETAYENWNNKFPGRVVMIHGKMPEREKQEALRRAKANEVSIIITTTVIEIGLTMPNLKGLMVVSSDKYGTSTLHQLRGRVSRHGGDGYFYMLIDDNYKDANPETIERLNLLVKHKKGSVLASEDMRLRGFGDLKKEGVVQAGNFDGVFPKIKMLPSDVEILLQKRQKSLIT